LLVSEAQLPELDQFLHRYRACLIVLSGPATGMEYVLDQGAIRLGRGPGVDLAIDDPSLEREHANLEFRDGCFWLCSVAREASTRLNGGEVRRSQLKDEDRIRLGKISFEYSIARR
jgi:predicted component of type VI protein secretion system